MMPITQAMAFMNIGPWQIVLILIVALLVFGKRLPEVARGLGRSLNEFKKGIKESQEDLEKSITSEDEKQKDNQP